MSQSILPAARKNAWQVLAQLWRTDSNFRGLVEFAVVGAIVLIFLHGAKINVLNWRGPSTTAPASSLPAASVTAAPAAQNWSVRLPALSDVIFDAAYFETKPEPLRSTLTAAAMALQSKRLGEVEGLLAGADMNDPAVKLIRGTVALASADPKAYLAGLELLKQSAAQGETKALTILGVAILVGHAGQVGNAELGRQYLQQAVDAGDTRAAFVLASGYFSGWTGRVDPVAGAGLMRHVAERGDKEAMFQYASMLIKGVGVAKSPVEGETWLLRAAELGHPGAQSEFGLARLYDFNRQLTPDAGPAVTWLSRAAEQKDAGAMFALGVFYASVLPSTGYSDPVRGAALLEKCGQTTLDARCTFAYATMVEGGRGTSIDLVRAYAFYRLSNDVKDTPEGRKRLKDLEGQLSGEDLNKARELARSVREQYVAGLPRRSMTNKFSPVPTSLAGP
jgi:TPR repeat protein